MLRQYYFIFFIIYRFNSVFSVLLSFFFKYNKENGRKIDTKRKKLYTVYKQCPAGRCFI